jgi:hypothetical protein
MRRAASFGIHAVITNNPAKMTATVANTDATAK